MTISKEKSYKLLKKFLDIDLSYQPNLEKYYYLKSDTDIITSIGRVTLVDKDNMYFKRDIESIFKFEDINLKKNDKIYWINGLANNPEIKTLDGFKLLKIILKDIKEMSKQKTTGHSFIAADVRNVNKKERTLKKLGFKILPIDLDNHFGIFMKI